MATRDEAHGKRCASVRFPVLASQPVSKARKAKARPIPKLGRHSSGTTGVKDSEFLRAFEAIRIADEPPQDGVA